MKDRESARCYEFGEYRLDAMRRVLFRDGVELSLKPKVFDTLLALVEHAGETLDKSALMDAVWPNVVVEEHNLSKNISVLRQLLGETPSQHRFIVTEPGRGYRFVARVGVVDAREVSRVDSGTRTRPDRAAMTWAAALVSVAVLGVALLLGLREPVLVEPAPANVQQPAAQSIAVLPFVDLSDEGDRAWFAEGISSSVQRLLVSVDGLLVAAPDSSFRLQNSGPDFAEAADILGISLLTGSVRYDDNRPLVHVELYRAGADEPQWLSDYPVSTMTEVFDIEETIAADVAAQMISRSSPPRPSTEYRPSWEVAALYREARHIANSLHSDRFADARNLLIEAIERDPSYAAQQQTCSAASNSRIWARSLYRGSLCPTRQRTNSTLISVTPKDSRRAISSTTRMYPNRLCSILKQ